jgi:hypothetical protein
VELVPQGVIDVSGHRSGLPTGRRSESSRIDTAPSGNNRAMPSSSIKDEKTYEKVRKSGASKEMAARVANAAANAGSSKALRNH